MKPADYLNEEKTTEYSVTEKKVVATVASFIFTITTCAFVLLYLELIG